MEPQSQRLADRHLRRRRADPALVNAGKELGLTQADLGAVVGRDRTALSAASSSPDQQVG